MREEQVDLALINNPLSMRYAVDYWNYPLFLSRIPSTILLIPVEGSIEISGAYSGMADVIDESLPLFSMTPFDSGIDGNRDATKFASYVRNYVTEYLQKDARIGVDRMDPSIFQALNAAGLDCCDITTTVERARAIKSREEVILIRHAVKVAELGMASMRSHLEPGITENQLWSLLHKTNIANGGFWTEGNMLVSGDRTNPWLENASAKTIESGELVAFDTDMVGPYSYFADVSRTWVCGGVKPDALQSDIYQRAYDEVYSNLELVRPGVTFREFSEKSFRQPERFHALRYPCVAHGVGMCDEYPKIAYPQDWDRQGYDGVIEEGMVLCIESYVGAERGKEGVKLEEQVLVTSTGYEMLTTYAIEIDTIYAP